MTGEKGGVKCLGTKDSPHRTCDPVSGGSRSHGLPDALPGRAWPPSKSERGSPRTSPSSSKVIEPDGVHQRAALVTHTLRSGSESKSTRYNFTGKKLVGGNL